MELAAVLPFVMGGDTQIVLLFLMILLRTSVLVNVICTALSEAHAAVLFLRTIITFAA
jgi:hypothetical protein